MDRRALLAAASGAFTAAVISHAKAAADNLAFDTNALNLSEAQRAAHAVRFPTLDANSLMDFAGGVKHWNKEYRNPEAFARREKVVVSLGYSTGPTELSFEESFKILLHDPTYQAEIRLARSIQELMWARARQALYAREDLYLSAMEATDRSGPGTLELNPRMHIPEYATYEIHEQPGGYVGDQFAGWMYHYALALAYYQGMFNGPVRHDEPHALIVQRTPLPADGKVRRVVELGCSDGRTCLALKERFPDAEIWGIDIGGPMVRYAHHRAAGMNLDINFAQRLAEDTRFPDNYFDIVVTNLLFHEVPAFAAPKIVQEAQRIMRPGGVWDLTDGGAGHPKLSRPGTIVSKAGIWVNHRYNNETWEVQWNGVDMYRTVTKSGFKMDIDQPKWMPIKA